MKTTTFFFPGIKNIFTLFIGATMALSSTEARNFGLDNFALMSSISGNGLGLHYSPMLGLRLSERVVVSAGPVFKADKPHYAGYVVTGNLTLMKKEDSFSNKTSLYAFMSFERNQNQYFSKGWIEIEELTSRHTIYKEFDFKQVRFSGYEITTGFALGYSFSENVSLNGELGMSVYQTKRLNHETVKLYHQPVGFVLHFSMTARFNINRD
jgi:hypothetical protein